MTIVSIVLALDSEVHTVYFVQESSGAEVVQEGV
jgi:hypothetical protein